MNFNPNPRILLLEDDPLAAWTARRILEQMGCRVSVSAVFMPAVYCAAKFPFGAPTTFPCSEGPIGAVVIA